MYDILQTATGKTMAKSPKNKTPRKIAADEIELVPDSEATPPEASPDSLQPEALPVVYNPYDPEVLEKGETAILPSDPLKRYLAEIRNSPVLTAEQEQALAVRMKEKGDVNAAKLLVSANLKNVVRIAYEYRSMYHNLLDLIQEGNIGLMKAVSKFDPTKGVRLGYYATWWIRSYILKYLLDNFRLVRVGTSHAQKKLFYHLMREKQRLEAQGIRAAPALLAQNLDVKVKDVIEMEQRLLSSGSEMSIDAPAPGQPDEPNTALLNLLRDSRESAEDRLEHNELLGILARELPQFEETLNEKEKKVLSARLLSEEPRTLQEVADAFGLTRERVRQIEAKLIEKLKKRLEPFLR
ncbi:sigma-70 family RNA polymerase sigma factor [bacterium]|jgi:RNA polymerase sigma-32 factor|nr:sigma-70 family RNA polymerase sigma factor [bacterium]